MPQIRVLSGPQKGTVYPMKDGKMIIGRDPKSDIPLDVESPGSRQHAGLYPDGKSWRIQDLGSLNGTKLNNARLEDSPLKGGDQITIGDAVFVFEDERAIAGPTPAPAKLPEKPGESAELQVVVQQ